MYDEALRASEGVLDKRVRELHWKAIMSIPQDLLLDDNSRSVADFRRRVASRSVRTHGGELLRHWEKRVMTRLRQIAAHVRRSPLHPQWLLPSRGLAGKIGGLRGTVLDVGCADRWAERHCAEGARYIGLDYPATGSQLYSSTPDVFADAACLPFGDRNIDALLCLEVLEHVRDHRGALREFSRVLKPDGVLLMSIPFMYPVHDAPHDYQRLTEHGLRRDLGGAGFEVIRLTRAGNAIRTAGLLYCLALAGGLHQRRRWFDYLRLPFVALGVLLINLASLGLAAVLPDWNALCTGYEVEAKRLGADGATGTG